MIELASDCSRCSGLCCVGLRFDKASGFGYSKDVGEPCRNLAADDRCTIHAELRTSGWVGCTVFECFGAGQRLTARAGSWRAASAPGRIFSAFSQLHAVHELLFLLTHSPDDERDERTQLLARVEQLAQRIVDGADADGETDPNRTAITALREETGRLLGVLSERARAGTGGMDRSRSDLAGHDLRRTPLRGGSLRGALLIAADLRGVDLTLCDLLGADLRDADLRGARLDDALFLTQPQVNAARGDHATTLPPQLRRPAHWPSNE